MITYDSKNGCYYHNETRHYHLYEAMTYKGDTTSDIIIIFDHDRDHVVNYVYGASTIGMRELDDVVTDYVNEYESNLAENAKTYAFTKAGTRLFLNSAMDDIYKALEDDREPMPDIKITVGNHQITVPMMAEIWEDFETFIHEAIVKE